MSAAVVTALRIYPIKGLHPLPVATARLVHTGALANDRRWAIVDATGAYLNGKRCPAIHRVRAQYAPDASSVTLSAPDLPAARFDLPGDEDRLARWMTEALGQPARITRDDGGQPDDIEAHGPTLIGAATLDEVRGWFPGIGAEDVRRRFRANVELGGVPAFWEDRLFGPRGAVVRFRLGGAVVEGTNPCQRCVVPSRDPDRGDALPSFQRRFAEQRRATLPPWADASRFDHFYRLAVNTRAPREQAGAVVRVGDPVVVEDAS